MIACWHIAGAACDPAYDHGKRGAHPYDVQWFDQPGEMAGQRAAAWLSKHPCKQAGHFHCVEGMRRAVETPAAPQFVVGAPV